MSVLLKKRKNANGTTSMFLIICDSGKRTYEFLKHLKLKKPTTPAIKQANAANQLLAEQIRLQRAQQLQAGDYGLITSTGRKTIITEWMQSYVAKYEMKDKRNMEGVLNRFIYFLEEKEIKNLTFGRLSVIVLTDFKTYLEKHSVGEGASSYFARFKKMIHRAYLEGLLQKDIGRDVKNTSNGARRKDTLTKDEIIILADTKTENTEVKRAFLFCLMTGLRWCDTKILTWDKINGRQLVFEQTKVKGEAKTVVINLNDRAMELIGTPGRGNVFELPTSNGANKTLKAWVKRAGINKKITWHNARHSAGTNMAANNQDPLTIASILGHSSLKYVMRYTKASNQNKQNATDALNF